MKTYPWPNNIFKEFTIDKVPSTRNSDAESFVKTFHYSGTLARGCKHNYILRGANGKIYGVAMFGHPVGKNYLAGTMECKRFVLMRKAPKNVASFFMARCLKDLRQYPEISQIVSYADPEHGHEGTLYKASNFIQMGEQERKGQAIMLAGQKIHLRAAYQKINGVPTKTAQKVQTALKSGKAKYISLAKKKIYVYPFK